MRQNSEFGILVRNEPTIFQIFPLKKIKTLLLVPLSSRDMLRTRFGRFNFDSGLLGTAAHKCRSVAGAHQKETKQPQAAAALTVAGREGATLASATVAWHQDFF